MTGLVCAPLNSIAVADRVCTPTVFRNGRGLIQVKGPIVSSVEKNVTQFAKI